MIITIGVTATILAAMLAWYFVASRGYFWLKGVIATLAILLTAFLSIAVNDLMGWPTNASLPNTYEVVGVEVAEKQGKIFIWVLISITALLKPGLSIVLCSIALIL